MRTARKLATYPQIYSSRMFPWRRPATLLAQKYGNPFYDRAYPKSNSTKMPYGFPARGPFGGRRGWRADKFSKWAGMPLVGAGQAAYNYYRGMRGSGQAQVRKNKRAIARIQRMEEVKQLNPIDDIIVFASGDWQASDVRCVNIMAQGNTNATREGNYCNMKSLRMRMTYKPAAVETAPHPYRILVIWDSRPDGVLAHLDDMMVGEDNINALYNNKSQRGRFQFLFDQSYFCGRNQLSTGAATTNKGRQIKVNINLKGKKTNYSIGNAGTIADIAQGALYICLMKGPSAQVGTVNFVARINYVDM